MSNWTHVAGIIRIDDLGRCLDGKSLNFEKLIGKEVRPEDWDDVDKNPEKYLPFGSEGSLKMTVWENPYEDDLFGYVVSIFGDLRDHHSAEEIIQWFKKVCENFTVRDAAITVRNEWYGTINWTYEWSD